MKYQFRELFTIVFTAIIFSIIGAFMIHAARAQLACANDAVCAGQLGPEFRCMSGRCNPPPPIWNAAGLTGAQDARVFLLGQNISNSLRVGNLQIGFGNQINNLATGSASKEVAVQFSSGNRGFTVYDGVDQPWFRVSDAGLVRIARGLSVGGNGIADAVDGEIRADRGAFATILNVAGSPVLTNVQAGAGIAISGTGLERTVALDDCAANISGQVWKWNGSNWACAADEVGAGGIGGDHSHSQYYLQTGDTRALDIGSDLTVSGNILLPSGTVDGVNMDDVLTNLTAGTIGGVAVNGTGHERSITLGTCPLAGQVWKWSGINWECQVDQEGINALTVCSGPQVTGATAASYDGDLTIGDGYREIDALCNSEFAGSHQCSTGEVMDSVHCGSIWTDQTKTNLRPAIPALAFAWISNGAPSLPTPTNDCYGWTQTGVISGQQSQGVAWYFDVRGGAGYARSCAEANEILCCR